MQLTDEQKQKVAAWLADGLKLSDIQGRLGDECGVRLTYMDVRLLVDDLKLVPMDPPAPAPVAEKVESAAPAPEQPAQEQPATPVAEDAAPAAKFAGKISLLVDQIARPGTIVSGSVTFSDGKVASWYLDPQGRLSVVPAEQGYRPPEGDVEEFQVALDQQLAKLGY